MGCGAIGGVITAALAETGHDVTAVTTNASIHAAIRERGIKVVGEGAPRHVQARVSLGVPPGEKFDYVILVDVGAQSFPATPAARRALHVGATRAVHQLWVTSAGAPSPLVRDWSGRQGGA